MVARLACVMCDRVICVNQEIADSIVRLGISRSRIEIAPAFLFTPPGDVEVPNDIKRWTRSRVPLVSTAMFFRPEYGFELLVQAMVRLRRSYPGIGCIVMGSGEGQAAAQETLAAQRMDETVCLTGDLGHEVCLALMSESAVFVRPTYCDGDSISVREALALGVPVVASNVGSRPSGTVLFEAGDLEGLVDALTRVIHKKSLGTALNVPVRGHSGLSPSWKHSK
jgi:glycosyltransferase involved in cell wall biosynthesis